ncbi:MAG: thioredoxin family protein [Phycisphaerae bacterium]|nr:thioredoxin family protein [Phycisphaerae bacterium]
MRTNIKVLLLAVVMVFSAASVSHAIGPDWMDNFEQAKAKAASEDKDLLVDFTGSDWCGWCIRLSDEVFQKDIFKTQAPKEFVLVALDYPRDKSLVSEETAKQNSKLKDDYGIRGYPTIYLMDESGRPYAQTGYQAGGAETYLAHLAELKKKHQERDLAFAAAKEAATDPDKARAIDTALESMGMALASQFYSAEIEQIMAFDRDNKAGLKYKYEQLAFAQDMATLLGQGKMAEAALALDEKLKLWNLPSAEALALRTQYEQQIFDAKVRSLMRAKKFDEAIELIQTQIENKQLEGAALTELQLTIVQAHSMKGDFETALKTVDVVIEENHLTGPALQEALSVKAQVYQAKRDTEAMKTVLGQAIEAAPETPLGKSMQSYLDRMKDTETK